MFIKMLQKVTKCTPRLSFIQNSVYDLVCVCTQGRIRIYNIYKGALTPPLSFYQNSRMGYILLRSVKFCKVLQNSDKNY